jgi:hypothetical protein
MLVGGDPLEASRDQRLRAVAFSLALEREMEGARVSERQGEGGREERERERKRESIRSDT